MRGIPRKQCKFKKSPSLSPVKKLYYIILKAELSRFSIILFDFILFTILEYNCK